jgi:Gamma-glutamyl cyclotransferase, AIG2-like
LVLVPSTDDFVEGTALELTTDELLTADKYEPENYQRIKIALESGKKAWIYAAVER